MTPEYQDRPDEDARIGSDVDLIVADLKRLEDEISETLEVKVVIESPGIHGLIDEVSSGRYDAVHYIGFGRSRREATASRFR